MKVNYFFLWNYNKLPFVYSIMNENERNILIINVRESVELKEKLSNLSRLDKVEQVIIFENNLKDYISSILYRILIYPFKMKKTI